MVKIRIDGVTLARGKPTEYRCNQDSCSWNTCRDYELFETEAEAWIAGAEAVAKANAEHALHPNAPAEAAVSRRLQPVVRPSGDCPCANTDKQLSVS